MTPEGIFSIVKLCQVYHLIILNLSWFIYNQIVYCTILHLFLWDSMGYGEFFDPSRPVLQSFEVEVLPTSEDPKTRSDGTGFIQCVLVATWKSYEIL